MVPEPVKGILQRLGFTPKQLRNLSPEQVEGILERLGFTPGWDQEPHSDRGPSDRGDRIKLLFVEGGTMAGMEALRNAHRWGFDPFLITRSPDCFKEEADLGCRIIRAETHSSDEMVQALHQAVDLDRPVGIVTFSEYHVPMAAAVAAELGLPFLDSTAARICRDKSLTREVLQQHGVPQPDFRVVQSLAAAQQAAYDLGYPCVLKPSDESGSFGVRILQSPQDLQAGWDTLAARSTNQWGHPIMLSLLVEEYLPGPEYSVETLTDESGHHRLGVTAKYLTPPPFFVLTGHDFPAPLGPSEEKAVVQVALAALEAVGFNFGASHTEIKVGHGGAKVIEINARLAGGKIPNLIEQATGINVIRSVLILHSGGQMNLTPTRNRAASTRFVLAPFNGPVGTVSGLSAAQNVEGVVEACPIVFSERSTVYCPAQSHRDRVAYVMATGPTVEESAPAAEMGAKANTFQIRATTCRKGGIGGGAGVCPGRLSGNLDILRLTPRGLQRNRRSGSRRATKSCNRRV